MITMTPFCIVKQFYVVEHIILYLGAIAVYSALDPHSIVLLLTNG